MRIDAGGHSEKKISQSRTRSLCRWMVGRHDINSPYQQPDEATLLRVMSEPRKVVDGVVGA
jgi:hypothetical protein